MENLWSVAQLVKKSPPPPAPFTEPEGSFSCSQDPATRPCTEPVEATPSVHNLFSEGMLQYDMILASEFPIKILYTFFVSSVHTMSPPTLGLSKL